MTLDQFFERLPKTGWRVDMDGDIRHRSRDCDGSPCCPLLAALPAHRRKEHDIGNPLVAANELGINVLTAKRLIKSADFNGEFKLRARLLAHCGLKGGAE